MILISVKSEIMDCKRQFEKDRSAEMYLKRVKKIHDLSRFRSLILLHPELYATRSFFKGLIQSRKPFIRRLENVHYKYLKTAIPLRVEIINTEANQLNLQLK